MLPFDPPETTFVKGVGLHCAMTHAENVLGEEVVGGALDGLAAEHGDFKLHRLPGALVPLATAASAWIAVDGLHPGSMEDRRVFFQEMGVFIADTNLNGIYKSLLSILVNPERLAKRIPGLWKTYFRGVSVDLDLTDLREGVVHSEVIGFGGAPHIGEMAEGWLKYAFELVGGTGVEVHERALRAGAPRPQPRMHYEIRWDKKR